MTISTSSCLYQNKQWPRIISLDAYERFSQKQQMKVNLMYFLVDASLCGTPRCGCHMTYDALLHQLQWVYTIT